MGFKALLGSARGMKHYLIASALVFLTGVLLGSLYSGMFDAFLDQKLEQLSEMVKRSIQPDHKSLSAFTFIFMNNTLLSIFMMFSGVLLGLFPLYFLVSNGLIVGYLGAKSAAAGQLDTFLIAVLPHGIIEIPAVVVACAYGLRLGFLTLEALRSFPSAERRSRVRQKYKALLKLSIPYGAAVVILLLAAAIIESTFTMWLVGK
jgi:stage II sporulation protein M